WPGGSGLDRRDGLRALLADDGAPYRTVAGAGSDGVGAGAGVHTADARLDVQRRSDESRSAAPEGTAARVVRAGLAGRDARCTLGGGGEPARAHGSGPGVVALGRRAAADAGAPAGASEGPGPHLQPGPVRVG